MTCKKGHSILNKNCSACRELKDEWYSKANKKDVFEDIEDSDGNLTDHRSLTDLYQRKDFQTTEVFEAKREYQSWGEEMLEKAKFKSSKDKKIWKYHIIGLSQREIAPKVKLTQPWVCRKIKKISKYLKYQSN